MNITIAIEWIHEIQQKSTAKAVASTVLPVKANLAVDTLHFPFRRYSGAKATTFPWCPRCGDAANYSTRQHLSELARMICNARNT